MKSLVSIKAFLSLVALCATFSASVATATPDLGSSSSGTPYDRYMTPVKNVLGHLQGSGASLDEVRNLVREGRSFRYSYTNPYLASMPAATAARRAGDCKDKALWLANQIGDSSVRFVIGKARSTSRISHAWLYWKDSSSRWWILDCTNMREPVAADRVSSSEYIPLYSYAKNGSFRHRATQAYATRPVATRRSSPVAAERP